MMADLDLDKLEAAARLVITTEEDFATAEGSEYGAMLKRLVLAKQGLLELKPERVLLSLITRIRQQDKALGIAHDDIMHDGDVVEELEARIRDLEGAEARGRVACPCKGQLTADEPQGGVCIRPTWESKREAAGLHPLIAVDYCMVPETLELWSQGVITGGVCCGHGRIQGVITVMDESSADKMRSLGYEELENPLEPESRMHFSPKTVVQEYHEPKLEQRAAEGGER